jgi:DNA-binding response OmpR family regulator
MHDFLTNAGYLVEQASDGEEAMQVMAVRVFDALIIDIRMPRKDGLEVLEELQATTPGIPTLVVTGLATNEELDQAVAFGAGRVLRKPFQLDDLLRSVREMLRET